MSGLVDATTIQLLNDLHAARLHALAEAPSAGFALENWRRADALAQAGVQHLREQLGVDPYQFFWDNRAVDNRSLVEVLETILDGREQQSPRARRDAAVLAEHGLVSGDDAVPSITPLGKLYLAACANLMMNATDVRPADRRAEIARQKASLAVRWLDHETTGLAPESLPPLPWAGADLTDMTRNWEFVPWMPAGRRAAPGYPDGLRLGVSSGGVIAVNGNPYSRRADGSRVINIALEDILSALSQAQADLPLAVETGISLRDETGAIRYVDELGCAPLPDDWCGLVRGISQGEAPWTCVGRYQGDRSFTALSDLKPAQAAWQAQALRAGEQALEALLTSDAVVHTQGLHFSPQGMPSKAALVLSTPGSALSPAILGIAQLGEDERVDLAVHHVAAGVAQACKIKTLVVHDADGLWVSYGQDGLMMDSGHGDYALTYGVEHALETPEHAHV